MARSSRQLNDKEMKYFEGVKPWGCTAGHPAGTTVRFTTDNRLYVRNGFSYATHLTTSHQRIRRPFPSCAGPLKIASRKSSTSTSSSFTAA